MNDVITYVLLGVALCWAATLEIRFWRAYRAIIILDTLIKAISRYARERDKE